MAFRKRETLVTDETFDAIAKAAAEGKRCPENGTFGVNSAVVSKLCREGRIRVEISGKNYRQVFILTGEHAGKATVPNPDKSTKPWKFVGLDTRKAGHIPYQPKTRGVQPSKPGLLPPGYFKD